MIVLRILWLRATVYTYANFDLINSLIKRLNCHKNNLQDTITNRTMTDEKIKELKKRIADLQNQWPAHSIPPAMMQLLDDLEEELAQAKQAQKAQDSP